MKDLTAEGLHTQALKDKVVEEGQGMRTSCDTSKQPTFSTSNKRDPCYYWKSLCWQKKKKKKGQKNYVRATKKTTLENWI